MKKMIKLGISTCPNDTFAFHGLLNRYVDWQGLEFEVQLLDVQELNQRLRDGQLDVAKVSFHAALLLSENTVVLPSGSALGFGVGPLLLSRHQEKQPTSTIAVSDAQPRTPIVLCPGVDTTATLLYQIFYPNVGELQQIVFSEIMPALQRGTADFGGCIHEGRFTWQESGLHLVEDLGTRWETMTGAPLPLGGILASRRLDSRVIAKTQAVIRDSLRYGIAHRDETLSTMRFYAQEFDDDVLQAHVDLYVSDHTLNLGPQGKLALDRLYELAVESNIISRDAPPLEIFDSY